MSRSFRTLSVLMTALAVSVPSYAASMTTTSVKLKPGATAKTYKGTIKGYSYNDYNFYAKAGQRLKVEAKGDVEVGLTGPKIGQTVTLVEYSPHVDKEGYYTLPGTGRYKIRVLQMRNSAREGVVAPYTMNIQINNAK